MPSRPTTLWHTKEEVRPSLVMPFHRKTRPVADKLYFAALDLGSGIGRFTSKIKVADLRLSKD